MIRAYLTGSDSRLQREDARWCADRVSVPRPAGGVQCHGAPALRDPSPSAVDASGPIQRQPWDGLPELLLEKFPLAGCPDPFRAAATLHIRRF